MEDNNRKGPGVFYAVVGVATLVVAIVGATFAYFSAADTDETITGTTAAAGGVELTVTPVTDTGKDMVPLNVIPGQGEKDTVPQLEPALKAGCIDANKNNVCQIYKINIANKSTTSTISVQGTLTLANTDNTSTANLYWKLLDANHANGAAPAYSTNVIQGTPGDITVGGNSIATVGGTIGTGAAKSTNVMAATADQDYYVMVWLEETGAAQEGVDAGAKFKGTVYFTAVDANGTATGITASFKSA